MMAFQSKCREEAESRQADSKSALLRVATGAALAQSELERRRLQDEDARLGRLTCLPGPLGQLSGSLAYQEAATGRARR